MYLVVIRALLVHSIVKLGNGGLIIDVKIELCGANENDIESNVIKVLDYFEIIEPECGISDDVRCVMNNININPVDGLCVNNDERTGSEILIVIESEGNDYISPTLTNPSNSEIIYENKLKQELDQNVEIITFNVELRDGNLKRIGSARTGVLFYTCLIVAGVLLLIGVYAYIRGTYCKKEIPDPVMIRSSALLAPDLTIDSDNVPLRQHFKENDEDSYGFTDSTTHDKHNARHDSTDSNSDSRTDTANNDNQSSDDSTKTSNKQSNKKNIDNNNKSIKSNNNNNNKNSNNNNNSNSIHK